jgi:hypothetical protein
MQGLVVCQLTAAIAALRQLNISKVKGPCNSVRAGRRRLRSAAVLGRFRRRRPWPVGETGDRVSAVSAPLSVQRSFDRL